MNLWLNRHADHADAFRRVSRGFERATLLGQSAIGRTRDLPRSRPAAPVPRYALAALALLGLAGVLLILQQRHASPAGEMMLVVATDIGQFETVHLRDKASLTLDTGTHVRLGGAEGAAARLDAGRVRVSMADTDRPVTIACGEERVTGSAAQFDVARWDGQTEVVVLRGGVLIERPGRPLVRMTAGQRLDLTGAVQATAIPEFERGWPSGRLSFKDTPLGTAVSAANRYSRRPIIVEDHGLAALRVSGMYRAGDTRGLARSLAAAFDLALQSRGGAYILSRAGEARSPSGAPK